MAQIRPTRSECTSALPVLVFWLGLAKHQFSVTVPFRLVALVGPLLLESRQSWLAAGNGREGLLRIQPVDATQSELREQRTSVSRRTASVPTRHNRNA